jgi:pilus assembly protein Flp/PilA
MPNINMIAAYLRARMTKNGDEGATAVEYGLLVSLIAVAIIIGVTAFGDYLGGLFSDLEGQLT